MKRYILLLSFCVFAIDIQAAAAAHDLHKPCYVVNESGLRRLEENFMQRGSIGDLLVVFENLQHEKEDSLSYYDLYAKELFTFFKRLSQVTKKDIPLLRDNIVLHCKNKEKASKDPALGFTLSQILAMKKDGLTANGLQYLIGENCFAIVESPDKADAIAGLNKITCDETRAYLKHKIESFEQLLGGVSGSGALSKAPTIRMFSVPVASAEGPAAASAEVQTSYYIFNKPGVERFINASREDENRCFLAVFETEEEAMRQGESVRKLYRQTMAGLLGALEKLGRINRNKEGVPLFRRVKRRLDLSPTRAITASQIEVMRQDGLSVEGYDGKSFPIDRFAVDPKLLEFAVTEEFMSAQIQELDKEFDLQQKAIISRAAIAAAPAVAALKESKSDLTKTSDPVVTSKSSAAAAGITKKTAVFDDQPCVYWNKKGREIYRNFFKINPDFYRYFFYCCDSEDDYLARITRLQADFERDFKPYYMHLCYMNRIKYNKENHLILHVLWRDRGLTKYQIESMKEAGINVEGFKALTLSLRQEQRYITEGMRALKEGRTPNVEQQRPERTTVIPVELPSDDDSSDDDQDVKAVETEEKPGLTPNQRKRERKKESDKRKKAEAAAAAALAEEAVKREREAAAAAREAKIFSIMDKNKCVCEVAELMVDRGLSLARAQQVFLIANTD